MESGMIFKTQEIKRVRNPDVDSCIRALGGMLEQKHRHKFITRRHDTEAGKKYVYDVFLEERGFLHAKTHFLFKVFVEYKVPGNPKKGIEVDIGSRQEAVDRYRLDIEGIREFIRKYIVG